MFEAPSVFPCLSPSIFSNCLQRCSSLFLHTSRLIEVLRSLTFCGCPWREASCRMSNRFQVLATISSWCWCKEINVWTERTRRSLSNSDSCQGYIASINCLRLICSLVCSSVRVHACAVSWDAVFGIFPFLREFDAITRDQKFVIGFQGGMMRCIDILNIP